MTTATITATDIDIVHRYADEIAYVAEQAPATGLDGFIDQLDTAASRFDTAGVNGHEDLETAGTLLAEARHADDDTERTVFLRKADKLLKPVPDMTGEYRGMVGGDEDEVGE